MNKLLLTLVVNVFCVAAYPQGTVLFQNYLAPDGINAPVYESDGVTPLSGIGFMAELLAGPSANNLASIATTGFLTGTGAGYFLGGVSTINDVVPGNVAWVEVRAWNTGSGASFDRAQSSGLPDSWWASPVFAVVTGNIPSGAGPTPPAPLTGLGTSPVFLNSVPEPSTFGLAALGAAVMLFRFRRRHRPAVSNR